MYCPSGADSGSISPGFGAWAQASPMPDPSAEADITLSMPRFHQSPGREGCPRRGARPYRPSAGASTSSPFSTRAEPTPGGSWKATSSRSRPGSSIPPRRSSTGR